MVFEKSFSRPRPCVSCGKLKRQIHIILIWLAMTITLPLQAAESPFTVDSWTTEDGLPQSSVISIVQTHDGYLWLATLNGLVRFDGNSFTPFDVNNTPGLPSDRIVYLFEDSGNTLWVGTDNAGLCAIKNGVVQKFNTGGGGNIIYACEDETGAVWFSTADGSLFCWKDGQLGRRSSNVPDQFSAELFYRAMHILVPGRNNVLWQLQGGQVVKFQANKLVKDFGPSPWKSSMVPESFKTPDIWRSSGLMPISLRLAKIATAILSSAPAALAFIGSMRRAVASTSQPVKAYPRGLCFHFVSTMKATFGWGRMAAGLTALRKIILRRPPAFPVAWQNQSPKTRKAVCGSPSMPVDWSIR